MLIYRPRVAKFIPIKIVANNVPALNKNAIDNDSQYQ
jgi:hypothetical protein